MVDPVVHAKMTMLIQQEKKLKEELDELEKEIPVWEKRIELARQKGMPDLARQAKERVEQLAARKAAISQEFDVIDMDKGMLRYEARRPSGVEVQRAEAMLDAVRLGGLVDPDAEDDTPKGGAGDADSDTMFDFQDKD